MTTENELRIATDFLRDVSDHAPAGGGEPFATQHDVLEACRDAIERLGLSNIYHQFRNAVNGDAQYAVVDGKVVEVADIGGGHD